MKSPGIPEEQSRGLHPRALEGMVAGRLFLLRFFPRAGGGGGVEGAAHFMQQLVRLEGLEEDGEVLIEKIKTGQHEASGSPFMPKRKR